VSKFREGGSQVLDAEAGGDLATPDRSIGDIIRQTNNLTAEQVEQILAHQREHGVRFGEAAIALGFANERDVLYALSLQFHYPYAPEREHAFSDELVMANKPFSTEAEAFRRIRSQVSMRVFNGEEPKPALAVVSADPGDGKSYFCANLAIALSQLGGRTLLVDADLRGPRQHELFGVDNSAGLSGVLAGRAERNIIHQVRELSSLFVLPVGTVPPNPLELLERPAFGLLLRDLNAKFDHVVVDTSAMSLGADSGVVAAKAGAALVVARKHQTRVSRLEALVAGLSQSPAKLAGVIMNEF
jgi:protein-tyrosine kinase